MKDNFDDLLLALLIGTIVGMGLGELLRDIKLKNEAIQYGVAHYNPTNSHFEWNTQTNK